MSPADESVPVFVAELARAWPVERWHDVPVLIAVSGGSDSIALLRGLDLIARSVSTEPPRLFVAHFNHRLRGAASDRDEAFVCELAKTLGRPCFVARSERCSTESATGIEEQARAERYAFFEQAAWECGARYLVTAHTADDQAETVLHRIVRGTGLAGLAGIPRVRQLNEACSLVRPLLTFRREALRSFLVELEQAYCEDDSNRDRSFTRNRIRHALLPQLAAEYNPGVSDALVRLAATVVDWQAWVDQQIEPLVDQAVMSHSAEQLTIALTPLREQPRFVLREVFVRLWQRQSWPLQAMGHDEWTRLVEFAQVPGSTSFTLPGGCVVQYLDDRNVITLRRVTSRS